jgi:hypothetical protein
MARFVERHSTAAVNPPIRTDLGASARAGPGRNDPKGRKGFVVDGQRVRRDGVESDEQQSPFLRRWRCLRPCQRAPGEARPYGSPSFAQSC